MRRFASVLVFVVALLASTQAFAQDPCTGATVPPDQASVQARVNSASSGDVLCLQAGNVTYTAGISLPSDRCIEIRGAGSYALQGAAGQTNIYINVASAIFSNFEPTMACSGGRGHTISNITFTADEDSLVEGTFGVLTWNRQGGEVTYPWYIHHNTFTLTGRCDKPKWIVTGAIGGVISRNIFQNEAVLTQSVAPDYIPTACNYAFTNLISVFQAVTDEGSFWSSANTFGMNDTNGRTNIYVEDNRFVNALAYDGNTSSRTVWRYNEFINSSIGNHGYDSSAQGMRHVEAYNNTWTCQSDSSLTVWASIRGGTGLYSNNTFNSLAPLCRYANPSPGNGDAIVPTLYKLIQAYEIGAWPGSYSGTYPMSHQTGWGWVSGSNQTVGSSTQQNQPGGAGFEQALEPMYVWNNTRSTDNLINVPQTAKQVVGGYTSAGRVQAAAAKGKGGAAGTTCQASAYVNVGQHVLFVFGDLVGGSAPTVSDDKGNTWNPLNGGTSGSLRSSAWNSQITTGGFMTVTAQFQSSDLARACVLSTMRAMTATPLDKNPAVSTITGTNTYDAPSPDPSLAQADEVVMAYFVLNGPTVTSGAAGGVNWVTDTITISAPDLPSVIYGGEGSIGVIGTSGGTDTSNVTVVVTYRYVDSTTAVRPRIVNSTAQRTALAGTVTFKNDAAADPSLRITDFIQNNREYYLDEGSNCPVGAGNTCSTGIGTGGTRANRPGTCVTGTAYAPTDFPDMLDICVASAWVNGKYQKYTYPHPMASVIGSSANSATISGGVTVRGGVTIR